MMALFVTLLLLVTPIISQQYSLIWYDTMGADNGDWTVYGDCTLAHDSPNCQTNLCARVQAHSTDESYIERRTTVSQYTSLKLTLYIRGVDLETNEQCQIWYKYENTGNWAQPINGNFGSGVNGVQSVDIPASSEQSIKIALEIIGDNDNGNDRCYFDNVYFYGIPVTDNPTLSPTNNPSFIPTNNPSYVPTNKPTNNPSSSPTNNPSYIPTNSPTSITQTPTINPSPSPTTMPTPAPTINPTKYPTDIPTIDPTNAPTSVPTQAPSSSPTVSPTAYPTWIPSRAPTYTVLVFKDKPTGAPTITIVHETTEFVTKNDNNNGDASSQNDASNGSLATQYFFIIIGSILIVCCVVVCWLLYCVQQKRRKRNNLDNIRMDEKQENIKAVEITDIDRVHSMSNGSSQITIIASTTPMGLTPMGLTPMGLCDSLLITPKAIVGIPALPKENDDNDSEDSIYLKGDEIETKETPHETLNYNNALNDENEDEDEQLYINDKDNITTAGDDDFHD